MHTKLIQLIKDGEGLTVEYKSCENEITSNVYETVSAFSNRYGGYIILGVKDSGNIIGVNPKAVARIKKDFISLLNNPLKFAPTLFLSFEEAEINGKTVLWCYVPPNSQVVMFGGRIYDRAEDGDMDITRNSEMVSQIHRRKAADYSERKIFPYSKNEDFEFERLMPKIRNLAANRQSDHPWASMSDMELLRSAGLYQDDLETGKSGFNLAAILLFGRPELLDGDVFKTIVPFILVNGEMSDKVSDNEEMSDKMSDNEEMSDKMSDKVSDNEEMSDKMSDKIYREVILAYIIKNGEVSATEAAGLIGRNPKTARRVLVQLVKEGIVIATGANRNRAYKIHG